MQYRVSGPDIAKVRSIALQLGQIMGADEMSSTSISIGWNHPAKCASKSIRIRLGFGLSSQALAEVLNTVTTGTPITQLRDNIYLINVVTRAQDEQRVSLSTLRACSFHYPMGARCRLARSRLSTSSRNTR